MFEEGDAYRLYMEGEDRVKEAEVKEGIGVGGSEREGACVRGEMLKEEGLVKEDGVEDGVEGETITKGQGEH